MGGRGKGFHPFIHPSIPSQASIYPPFSPPPPPKIEMCTALLSLLPTSSSSATTPPTPPIMACFVLTLLLAHWAHQEEEKQEQEQEDGLAQAITQALALSPALAPAHIEACVSSSLASPTSFSSSSSFPVAATARLLSLARRLPTRLAAPVSAALLHALRVAEAREGSQAEKGTKANNKSESGSSKRGRPTPPFPAAHSPHQQQLDAALALYLRWLQDLLFRSSREVQQELAATLDEATGRGGAGNNPSFSSFSSSSSSSGRKKASSHPPTSSSSSSSSSSSYLAYAIGMAQQALLLDERTAAASPAPLPPATEVSYPRTRALLHDLAASHGLQLPTTTVTKKAALASSPSPAASSRPPPPPRLDPASVLPPELFLHVLSFFNVKRYVHHHPPTFTHIQSSTYPPTHPIQARQGRACVVPLAPSFAVSSRRRPALAARPPPAGQAPVAALCAAKIGDIQR